MLRFSRTTQANQFKSLKNPRKPEASARDSSNPQTSQQLVPPPTPPSSAIVRNAIPKRPRSRIPLVYNPSRAPNRRAASSQVPARLMDRLTCPPMKLLPINHRSNLNARERLQRTVTNGMKRAMSCFMKRVPMEPCRRWWSKTTAWLTSICTRRALGSACGRAGFAKRNSCLLGHSDSHCTTRNERLKCPK